MPEPLAGYLTKRRQLDDFTDLQGFTDDELAGLIASVQEEVDFAATLNGEVDPTLLNLARQDLRSFRAELDRRNPGAISFPHLEDETLRNKYQPQTWGEFVATDFGGQPYTIQDLLPDQGLAVIHGRGKEQKSTLVIHECRAIAIGEPFLEKPTRQKTVLYVNYEMPFDYFQKLLGACGETPANAYVLNRPEPILTLETVDNLFQKIIPGGLMVIDSFRGAFRLHGESENHAGGAGLILRGLQDIALKHKGLVQVIHHRNRNQGRDGTDAISGTSDWIAAPDVIWSWSRPDKEKPGTLVVEGRMAPIDPLSISVSPEECLFLGSVKESQERTDKETIVGALTEEGQTADAIAQVTNLPPGTVRARLESLFRASLVHRDGKGKRGNPFLWSKINSAEINPYSAETNPGGGKSRASGSLLGS